MERDHNLSDYWYGLCGFKPDGINSVIYYMAKIMRKARTVFEPTTLASAVSSLHHMPPLVVNPLGRTEVPGKERFDIDTENPTDEGNLYAWKHAGKRP